MILKNLKVMLTEICLVIWCIGFIKPSVCFILQSTAVVQRSKCNKGRAEMENQYSKSWNKNTMNSLLAKLLLGSLVQGEECSETREEVKKRKKIAAAKNPKNEVPMIQRNNCILVLSYQKVFK